MENKELLEKIKQSKDGEELSKLIEYTRPELKIVNDLMFTHLFPERVFYNLPNPLKTACYQFDDPRERDVFLWSAITCLSSVFSENTFTYFNRQIVYCNMYSFIVAKSGSGKGIMSFSKDFIHATNKRYIDSYMRDMEEYERELSEMKNPKEKEQHKKYKPLFISKIIPSNITTPRFIQMLESMQDSGVLMFESEADAILKKLKSEHGEYTDIFRKAFTHETVEKLIKQNDEVNRVESPRLSILCSGTPNQPKRMFSHNGNAENGTLQRFSFYVFNKDSEFVSVWDQFINNGQNLPKVLKEMSEEIDTISRMTKIQIKITDEQSKRFELFWRDIERKYKKLYGEEIISVTRRLSLTFVRVAMILQRLKSVTHPKQNNDDFIPVYIQDEIFVLTCEIMNVITNHTFVVWEMVTGAAQKNKEDDKGSEKTDQSKFFFAIEKYIDEKEGFEMDISTSELVEIAESMNISESTMKRYRKEFINSGLLEQVSRGVYNIKMKDDD